MAFPLRGIFRYLLNGHDLSIDRELDTFRSAKSGHTSFTTTTGASVYDVPASRVFHPTLIIISNSSSTAMIVTLYDGTGTSPGTDETKTVIYVGGEESVVLTATEGLSFATDARAQLGSAASTVYVTLAGVLRPQTPSEEG